MTSALHGTAFEARGCRALATLGGRLVVATGIATAAGLATAAGRAAVPTCVQVLVLCGLAGPAVGAAGALLPAHGRHAADVAGWAPRSVVGRRALALLLVVAVLACGLAVLHRLTALAPLLGWPRVEALAGWVVPGFGVGLALATGPLRGLVSLAVLAGGLRVLMAPEALPGLPATIGVAALPVAAAATVHLVARQGFRATELAARAAEAAEAARRRAGQEMLARRRTDRVLHDTVLATLTLLAHAGVGVPAAELRAACRRDLAVLGGSGPTVIDLAAVERRQPERTAVPCPPGTPPGGPDDLTARLSGVRAQAARSGLDLRVHLQATPPAAGRAEPDPAVLRAWSGALAECVTNVARHAGVAAADVVVGVTGDRLVTVVLDEGVGFDPAQVPPGRLGLAGSVHERLVEVGGRARVWSTPGQGTVVELQVPWSWRARVPAPSPPATVTPPGAVPPVVPAARAAGVAAGRRRAAS